MAQIEESEALVEFNRLSDCQSALFEDVLDKSDLAASLFDKFFFPIIGDSADSSDDEFLSFASSTAGLCSSECINPHLGIPTSRPSSQPSSDGMSQLGTARDFHEIDIQNDLERDQDNVISPLYRFVGREFDGDLSEDKHVMTMQVLGAIFPNGGSKIEQGRRPSNSGKKLAHDLVEQLIHPKGDKKIEQHQNDYSGSSLLCAWCNGDRVAYQQNLGTTVEDNNKGDTNEGDPTQPIFDANDGEHAVSEELLMYETSDDVYETFDLRIIHRTNKTGFEENRDFPVVINSLIACRYYVTEFLGSAAFSKVVRAHDLHMGIDVCLKIIKNDKEFFDQSLDEIKLLKFVNKHDPADVHHILRLYDYFYFQEHLFIVTELLKENLYEYQKLMKESGGDSYFTMHRLQAIARQCLEALLYLHDLGIIHCDLKPENVLFKSYRRCEIKIIDLGSSCFLSDDLSLYVQSRSYRAPEVMLGLPYDQKIDLWSIGCILAEMYSGDVIFPNEAVAVILARIICILGPIDKDMLKNGQYTHKYFTDDYELYFMNEETNELEYIIPETETPSSLENYLQIYDSYFIDFLKCLLEINPNRRPTAEEALQHPWLECKYEGDQFCW